MMSLPKAFHLAAVLLFLAGVGLGQEPPERTESSERTTSDASDAAPQFFDRLAVQVVNVEVYVADQEGNPVTDLTVDDFEVSEDDRPVEVVNFYRVANGVAAPVAAPQATATGNADESDSPPRRDPRAVEAQVPESQRLRVIVYVDNFNIHPLNRNRVFARLRAFLRQNLSRNDQVMLASYDRSLNIRQPFTADSGLVRDRLVELEGMTGYALQREAERRDAVREIYESRTLNGALRIASRFSNNAHFELRESLQGLTEMVDSLAGLPGRKMLLYVSDGLPTVPGQSLYQAIQQRFADISALGEAITRDESRNLMQLIGRANSNRISFYAIDAGGLRTSSGMGAENRAASTSYVVSSAIDSVHTKNLRDTLILMADRTGGQAVYNTNDIGEGLERFARDFDNYYSLGYRAPVEDRGLYHRIEVRLKDKRRGWTLRHREGYRDKDFDTQIADAMASFLVHGYQSNPLGALVELGEQVEEDDDLFAVAIRVRVPVARVALLPRPGYREGRLSIYLVVADDKGRQSPRQAVPFELRIPEESLERALGDDVSRVISATMRPGEHLLVIGVRDEISEVRSVIGQHVVVAKKSSGD